MSAPPERSGVQGSSYPEILERLAGAQKTTAGAPAYSRFVNRPLGRRFAAAAFLSGLTPNIVTAASAAFSFSGIAVIALVRPTAFSGILIAVLLVLGYALDAADGQLARLRGGGSSSGEWLDHIVDAAKISALHLAVLISFYRFFGLGSAEWLLVPIAFSFVADVMFFGMILNDLLRARFTARTGEPVIRQAPSTIRSLLVIPTDYGFLCLFFAVMGATRVFLVGYSLFFVCNALFLALAVIKWFRDMHVLDAPIGERP